MKSLIKIIFGGDVSPGEGQSAENILKNESLFSDELSSVVKEADLCVINLETVLGETNCKRPKIGVHLKTNKNFATVLKKSGIGCVNLANNHIFDYGINGVELTQYHLNAAKIQSMGVGATPDLADQLKIINVGGCSVGFLSYAEHEFNYYSENEPSTAVLNPEKNVLHIQEVKHQCDILIIFTHCGPEGHNIPSPRMVRIFHAFADAGADAIINCHAHCIMGKEMYKNTPIYYGLGNLFFPLKKRAKNWWYKGLMAELTFEDFKFVHSKEIMTSFENQDKVHIDPNENTARQEFLQISNDCKNNAIVEKKWLDFCKSQRKHLLKQFLKGIIAVIPYFITHKLLIKKQWKNDSHLAAKGIRMLRGLLMCENHIDEFRTIFNDLMRNGL